MPLLRMTPGTMIRSVAPVFEPLRRHPRFLRFAVLAASLALAAPPAFGSAFSEFRIPRHTWFSLNGDLLGGGHRSHRNQGSYQERTRQLDGIGRLAGTWGLDDDVDFQWLSASIQTRYSRRSTGAERHEWNFDHALRQDIEALNRYTQGDEQWQLSGAIRRYPWGSPIGLMLSARGAGQYLQNRNRLDHDSRLEGGAVPRQRVVMRSRQSADTFQHEGEVTVSVGAGKVRDATPVFSAHVIESRLLEAGAITRRLRRETLEKLAALLAVQPLYRIVHDRPSKFFWDEVEELLRQDGALANERLGAHDVFRAVEDLGVQVRGGFVRRRGTFVGPSLGASARRITVRYGQEHQEWFYVADTLYSSFSAPTSSRLEIETDDVVVGATAETHWPLGMRWQLDASSRITLPRRDFPDRFWGGSEIVVSYLIADRWAADAFVSHGRTIDGVPGNRLASWDFSVGIDLGFYIEDRTRLSLRALDQQRRQDYPGQPHPYARDASFSLGVSYRFLGGLDVPGLIEPLRPLP